MKNIVYLLGSLIALIFLSNCTPHQFSGGAAHKCYGWFGERIPGCVDDRPGYNSDGSYSSLSSSSNSSSSYSSSEFRPVLFYDSATGGMKECNHVPTNGRCNSFKTYSSASYNKNTLFYDSNTDSMRPCLGTVTMTGKCTMFGLYKRSLGSKNQLFYDSKNNKMTTCRSVSATGQCLALDLNPRTGSTGGTYIVDDPSNPYYKKVPQSSTDLIKLGNSMLSGSCTLGLNC